MELPRVSVVMAVFNNERWLSAALDSVLGQSGVAFELIVVEDGSSDSSPAILRDYARRDSRIVRLENAANQGLTRSLNLGLAQARGEYLARLDADDRALPGRLAAQAEYLDRHPEVGVLGGGTRLIDEQDRVLGERVGPEEDQSLRAELLIKNNAFAHSSVMLRTELLRRAGGYDESFRYAQDYELWTRLGRSTRLACLPQVLVEWRSAEGNISSRHRREQLECQYRTSQRELEQHLGDALDREAYRRFWFALHGQVAGLEQPDLDRLEPLWSLLSRHRGQMPRTLESLSGLAYALLRQGRPGTGFRLLAVLQSHCGCRPRYTLALRGLLGSLLNAPLRK